MPANAALHRHAALGRSLRPTAARAAPLATRATTALPEVCHRLSAAVRTCTAQSDRESRFRCPWGCTLPLWTRVWLSDGKPCRVQRASTVSAVSRYDAPPLRSNELCRVGCSRAFRMLVLSQHMCPAGRFGCSPRVSDPLCNGPCTAGYYCNAGAVSNVENSCGDVSLYVLPLVLACDVRGLRCEPPCCRYCPSGAAAPLVAASGYATVGGDEAHRTAVELCAQGSYCQHGVAVRVVWFAPTTR